MMDLMKHPVWSEAVTAMYSDQGFNVPPAKCMYEFGNNRDPKAAERFLEHLDAERRITFFIGDYEERDAIMQTSTEARAAWHIIEDLWLHLFG